MCYDYYNILYEISTYPSSAYRAASGALLFVYTRFMIDPHIFRAYDIRGKAGTQLTEEACYLIGRAFGTVLQEKYGKEHEHPTVVLGRDARTHSPGFMQKMCEGLMQSGCEVFEIGQTPSPVNYFTICSGHFDAGVQITASHNPKEDNGIKLQLRHAEAYSGDDLQDLKKRIENNVFKDSKGSKKEIDAITPYEDFLAKLFADAGKGKTIVVDGGNGVAGPVYCSVLRKTGATVHELYTEPDGTFPNHAADPSKHSTLKELQEKVRTDKADIGFAFDGDGDRTGIVDERGNIVTADQTLLLLAQDHLTRHKGAPIIFTVSNSSLLETETKKWGGKPVMCKVGHSFVEHAMRDNDSLLGGEQSGHFFCGENYFGFDDALVASLRVLLVLHTHKKAVSGLIAEFPKVYQALEMRPHCPDNLKAEIVANATNHFQKTHPVITLDGARIDFGDGAWAGIRYSNTSPCLSICIEARSEAKLTAVETEVLSHLRTYPEIDWKR